jgi:mono/diheme cytochrome c family protein
LREKGISPIVVLAAAVLATALLLPWHVRAASSAPSFTSAQVNSGNKYFEATCSPCHGTQLEGGAGPALTGPAFKTLSTKVKASVGDIFTYMSTNMPLNAPASLTHDQYVSIMAFILSKNGYHAGSTPLTFSAASNSSAPPLNPH